MLKPVNGMQFVLPLIDHIVETKPSMPPLVIAVTSADPADSKLFVDGYHDRLRDIKDRPLVPSARVGAITLAMARAAAEPDTALFDEIVNQLRSSIPSGAGRRWRAEQFALCLDVFQAAGHVHLTETDANRDELLDWLYKRWEGRRKLLSWAKRVSASGELPSKVLGFVITALLQGPSRWLFARRLNSRKLQWFGEHVVKATGLHGDFIGQAVYLLPDGMLGDVRTLRRRILFDALLRDVALFMRRRRFFPHRRRRRWTPVLMIDAHESAGATLVDLYDELSSDRPAMPLLVIAAMPEEAVAKDETVVEFDAAAQPLRELVDQQNARQPRRIVLRLPADFEPDPVARNYLSTHRLVTPKVPGRVSALAPLVLTVLLLLASSGFAAYRYFGSGCADTKVLDSGERVGVIESGCSFGQPYADDVPHLSDLENEVFENNAFVDSLRGEDNEPLYYREVVFFAPLTRPDIVGRTAPPNSIWQLQGAVRAQREHNNTAKNGNLVPIKLILANSGDRFAGGAWVAAKIAARPHAGQGELAAVIGISQSRQEVRDVILGNLKGIPVIGASMYGSAMVAKYDISLTAPLNPAFAATIATWLREMGDKKGAVVYDPDDTYFSAELHSSLRGEKVGSEESDIKVSEKMSEVDDEKIGVMCEHADTRIPILVGRADQTIAILSRMKNLATCANRKNPMAVLVGPGMIVEAAAGKPGESYDPDGRGQANEWLDLYLTSLANTAVGSETSTGNDAFRFAAEAIKDARSAGGPTFDAILVQTSLKQIVPQKVSLPTLNDAKGSARIQVIKIG
ncbi:hypothetical protein Acsp05_29040 [Actinokineospora sp. NBRC 105648]|nr:hypothetical protein Acsp05_29040 [Actinokineospora sp. NBRC 105648]